MARTALVSAHSLLTTLHPGSAEAAQQADRIVGSKRRHTTLTQRRPRRIGQGRTRPTTKILLAAATPVLPPLPLRPAAPALPPLRPAAMKMTPLRGKLPPLRPAAMTPAMGNPQSPLPSRRVQGNGKSSRTRVAKMWGSPSIQRSVSRHARRSAMRKLGAARFRWRPRRTRRVLQTCSALGWSSQDHFGKQKNPKLWNNSYIAHDLVCARVCY